MTTTVTNRDLLRNYKNLRNRLISGELEEIDVPQKNGMVIKFHLEMPQTPMQKLLKMVKDKPLKGIKRPTWDII